MEQSYDKKLLKFIKYTPIIVIGLATIAIIAIMFYDNRSKAQEKLDSLRSDYIHQEKVRIQLEVESVYHQLVYEKSRMESVLKDQIRQRVYEAHSVASNLYKNNTDKSEQEITKLITDALRDVRFNDGRGYYFIYKMDGTNIMLPHLAHLEGASLWDMRDSRSSFIIRELSGLVKEKGEGFHRWWFYKPQDLENDLNKIGFVKYFEPLDWFIGTGEYIDDFEKDVQSRLLSWISEIRFGEFGFLFGINESGKIIAHQDDQIEGADAYHFQDENGTFYIQELLNTAKSGGGFVQYQSPFKPDSVQMPDKVSYVRWFEEWGWAVGAGIYVSELEIYLKEKEQAIIKQNDAELVKLMIFSFLLASILFVVAAYLSGRLSTGLRKYQARINHDFSDLSYRDKKNHFDMHDSLTDLPNRIKFNQLVRRHIQDAELSGHLVAIVVVDLDDFKKLNEQHGHTCGDKLLKVLGQRFEAIIDYGDSVSRIGGDEFIFCFPGLVKKDELTDKLEIIQKVFSDQFTIDGEAIFISATMGVATYPDDGMIAEELVSNANVALYVAQGMNRGGVQYYDSSVARLIDDECNS